MTQWGRFLLDEIEKSHVPDGSVALWSIGGAGVVLKTSETIVYIDPFLGGSSSPEWLRMVASPINPEDIRFIDAVISTHEHEDHCEEFTIRAVAERTNAVFIGPVSSADRFREFDVREERIVEMKPGDFYDIKDLRVRAYEANDPNAESALIYVLESYGIKILHSGDSLYTDVFHQLGRNGGVEVALLNLGRNPPGRRMYMNLCEVLESARDLKAEVLVPIHWDLWKHTYEDPRMLKTIAETWGLDIDIRILRLGDSLVYPLRTR
ncbi:MAG: MBL fold metallo-hydrolase [Candidatus Bathyarchaeota archaeon B24]|nr:MAG: MBL fold metallo-hydrolase [Candidatus Bathyarchaeota archaeon B24]RLI26808.1 MAG: hypothetical protein DRO57_00130 [Candidatus Bathyarchaeota archaeon]